MDHAVRWWLGGYPAPDNQHLTVCPKLSVPPNKGNSEYFSIFPNQAEIKIVWGYNSASLSVPLAWSCFQGYCWQQIQSHLLDDLQHEVLKINTINLICILGGVLKFLFCSLLTDLESLCNNEYAALMNTMCVGCYRFYFSYQLNMR